MRSKILRWLCLGVAALVTAVVLPAAPAQAAWGVTVNVSIQVTHPNGNLGSVSGTIQFETNTTQFRYDLTFCRQSSYTPPYLNIGRNYQAYSGTATPVTTVYPSSSVGCAATTGTVTAAGTIQDLYLVLNGNTFEGSSFVTRTQDTWANSPYA